MSRDILTGQGHTPKGVSRCPDVEMGVNMENCQLVERIQQVIRMAGKLKHGIVTHVQVLHGAGCPAIKTQRLADCVCVTDIYVAKPEDTE